MESALFFLMGLGIFIFLVIMRNEFLKKFEILNKNLFAVHKQLKALEPVAPVNVKEKSAGFSSLIDTPVKGNSLDLSSQSPVVESPLAKAVPVEMIAKEKTPLEKFLEKDSLKTEEKMTPVVKMAEAKPLQPVSQTPKMNTASSPKPATDFEKLIGENWLNKIGIGILVIGIGFFVKYAIDKNWIGPVGRLSIGIGAAAVMIGIAHWMHKKYHAFSSVLMGGAVATLYYTISIGYHDYKLFSQVEAFSIMTVITLFATGMSIWYGRRELAIIGLIGGFTAPFMVAGETNNAAVFFTYITILNTGMLILSFFKKWIELNRMAFAFSMVYLISWIFMHWMKPEKMMVIGMTFLVIFFIQFLTMNLVYNVVKKIKFNTWEFIHLLSITGIFYGMFMYVIQASGHGDLEGIFTIALGTLFTALTILFKRLPGAENNLVLLLAGKAVTFLTLTVFIQFDGHLVTLFWALEAVIIYWLGMKANMNLLKNTAMLITGIATISLVAVWFDKYQLTKGILPFFNTAFVTGMLVVVCYGVLVYLFKKDKAETKLIGMNVSHFSIVLRYWFFIAMYLVLLLEVIHQSKRIYDNEAELIIICIFNLVYLAVASILANWKGTQLARKLFFGFGIVFMILYVVFGNMTVRQVRDGVFEGSGLELYYQLHYLMPLLFVLLVYVMQKMLVKYSGELKHQHTFILFASVFALYVVCAEMDHFAVYKLATTVGEQSVFLRHTQIAGYTIVWGLYSFAIMILGMRKKARSIRVFALIAFSITLVKLFAFDIRNISEGGKIIAFISLGVMLLVVSFLYQKLKRMIVDGQVGE